MSGCSVYRAVVVATGVTATGDREVLGVEVGASEEGVFWTGFLLGLRARGLSGVKLVISDHHLGLKQAIQPVFVGSAWQRSLVHNAVRREGPVSHRPLVGEGLGNVTFEVHRQTYLSLPPVGGSNTGYWE